MTGPLAPLFTQVRKVLYIVEMYGWPDDKQLAFDALSSIERHVQDMDALVLDMGEWIRRGGGADRAVLLSRLSRLGAGDSNQNEKEQT